MHLSWTILHIQHRYMGCTAASFHIKGHAEQIDLTTIGYCVHWLYLVHNLKLAFPDK